MKKYVKTYLDHFNYVAQDFIRCEKCGGQAVDIHHIRLLSAGGTDKIDNLIGLCRRHHDQAHAGILTEEKLLNIIKKRNYGSSNYEGI